MTNHVGVQMTAGAGVDLLHRHSGRRDAPGIVVGLLVPLNDGTADLAAQVFQGPLKNGGLAGAGRADQIEGEDSFVCEEPSVAVCQTVVLGEDVGFDGYSAAGTVVMMVMIVVIMAVVIMAVVVMIFLVIMVIMMVMIMVVWFATAGNTHG
jgi:hypothetical protein